MTKLTVIQGALKRISLISPASVEGSSDQSVSQMNAILEGVGPYLLFSYPWQQLRKEHTFTYTDDTPEALPSDFAYFIDGTMWNRTSQRKALGPLEPQKWQTYKSGINTNSYEDVFIVRENKIEFLDNPGSDTFAFEYMRNTWVLDADGTTQKSSSNADTDTFYFDEELLTLGCIWMYLDNKGYDYAEAFNSFEKRLSSLRGRDGGKRVFNLGGQVIPRVRAPDGDWLQ